MSDPMKVLVTGADQHQGLAVIRGFGLAGIPVVACGPAARSLSFYSRFAVERYVYTPPARDPARFIAEIISAITQTGARLVVPAVESTLVVLNEHRAELERWAPLAASDPASIAVAVDKLQTVRLARELDVPVPATLCCDSVEDALSQAATLRFPVALKPRGAALHGPTRHHLGFKVRYAVTLDELGTFLRSLPEGAGIPLIQKCVRGTGVCVSAVFDRGRPLVLFPYRRTREVPLSGGVSVLRESIPLDPRLRDYVVGLLGRLRWHGVAMVEFKHDQEADRFILMEINPRFQASTALSLDAGLNLPHLVAYLFGCAPAAPLVRVGRIGVRERWLEGDLSALFQHLRGGSDQVNQSNPRYRPPSRLRATWQFLRDFRPGTRYDEFKLYDWRPGLVQSGRLLRTLAGWLAGAVRLGRGARPRRAATPATGLAGSPAASLERPLVGGARDSRGRVALS